MNLHVLSESTTVAITSGLCVAKGLQQGIGCEKKRERKKEKHKLAYTVHIYPQQQLHPSFSIQEVCQQQYICKNCTLQYFKTKNAQNSRNPCHKSAQQNSQSKYLKLQFVSECTFHQALLDLALGPARTTPQRREVPKAHDQKNNNQRQCRGEPNTETFDKHTTLQCCTVSRQRRRINQKQAVSHHYFGGNNFVPPS